MCNSVMDGDDLRPLIVFDSNLERVTEPCSAWVAEILQDHAMVTPIVAFSPVTQASISEPGAGRCPRIAPSPRSPEA